MPYPFAVAVTAGKVESVILVDQLKSMDWAGRRAEFHSRVTALLLSKIRQYIGVLLAIQSAPPR